MDNLDSNTKKGLLFGTITVFLVGLQPVIANSRPQVIDAFIFAAITALIEAVVFLPFYYFERRKLRLNQEIDKNAQSYWIERGDNQEVKTRFEQQF